ncbi:MAG TPA: glycosyltransferase family 9 protein, partial [Anaerolineaceae bacterium]|nr:glycosyltransferase family 9 protein [Anaerolineaceae bacterium]
QNEILRLLECVGLAGAEPVSVQPTLSVIPADRAEIEAFIPDPSRQLAVIHAGATDPRRHWGEENFAQVGDRLAADGYTVVLVGMQAERAATERIEQLMRHPALNLAGRISLGALVGLIERACILVANDSGPIHLAEALGTPSVGIYWAGNMVNFGPAAVARHRQLLSWQLDCPVCGRNTIYDSCEHRDSYVRCVPVQDVVDAVWDVLAYAQKVGD